MANNGNSRARVREVLDDADVQVVGGFGGLSTATRAANSNVNMQHKLINAYVSKRNEIQRRAGSKVVLPIQGNATTTAQSDSAYSFVFTGVNYLLIKSGVALRLVSLDASGNFLSEIVKLNVFLNRSVNEQATFTTVIEDNTCFVLIATKSTELTVITLLNRDYVVDTVPSTTQYTANITQFPSATIGTQKIFTYNSAGVCLPLSAVFNSGFVLTFTTSAVHNLQIGERGFVHYAFVNVCNSAAYYPGSYLYNTALRKNLVPLDVNVQMPNDLVANPVLTEPPLQPLNIESYQLYKTNNATATKYNKVATRQPATVDDWDFSDGSYRVDPSVFTNQSSAFAAFGALQTPTTDTRVFCFRLRSLSSVLPTPTFCTLSRLTLTVDKFPYAGTYYAQNGSVITNDLTSVDQFSLARTNNPGVSLSSVVEIVYRLPTTRSNNVAVDLSENISPVIIDDFNYIPLYGYTGISFLGTATFPPIVQSVGNRVVLTGLNNRMSVSNADWLYRGISWNNFQVSTISFSATSAYQIVLTQDTSIISAVLSVNGVLLVASDSGIYRVSGTAPNQPPNAQLANVSRVSNEVVSRQDNIIVYNNQVFYTSTNGLYSLEYNRETEEIMPTPVSQEVSNLFTPGATGLIYSNFYRSLIMSFNGVDDLLVYNLETETFAQFRIAGNASVKINQTLDGFKAVVPSTVSGQSTIFYCVWDSGTVDFANIGTFVIPTNNLIGTSQTFFPSPSLSRLVTPAELLSTINPALVQSYQSNSVRVIGSNSVLITEVSVTNAPLPVISAFVTKNFAPPKLIAANRIRAVNLLVGGSGAAKVSVAYQAVDYNDRVPETKNIAINSTDGYRGESLLNYAYESEQTSVGSPINVRIRTAGISEAFEIAVVFDGTLVFVGYQIDSSAKKRGRLR
jgi:hypothetical protein